MTFGRTLNNQRALASGDVFSGISLGRLMRGFLKKVASMTGAFFKALWSRMLDKLRTTLRMTPEPPPPEISISGRMSIADKIKSIFVKKKKPRETGIQKALRLQKEVKEKGRKLKGKIKEGRNAYLDEKARFFYQKYGRSFHPDGDEAFHRHLNINKEHGK